MGQTASFTTAT